MHKLKKIFFKKKILIYGLGTSGSSSFHYLKKNNQVKVHDDNIEYKNNKIYKKYFLNKADINEIIFDHIVISPGINSKKCGLKNFLRINKKKICTDLDIFYTNNYENKMITVTGTNGKSTTVKLISEIFKNAGRDTRAVGNIGNSILNEKKIKKNTLFVIEASSYQIEYSKFFKSDYSIILNINFDHIERHGTFKNYLQAKLKLFYNKSKRDYALFNKNNLVIKNAINKKKIKCKIINVSNKIDKKYLNEIENKYLLNKNNLENLSFIIKICEKFKIKKSVIVRTINKFKGLKYRQQIIYNSKNILVINDSKSTSFSSTINLINSYENIFWLVGGQPKKGDIFNYHKKSNINIQAYIFGKNKNFFKNKLKNKIKFQIFLSIKKALKKALIDINKTKISTKKILLFSPSSASFDEFSNFEERGDYFNLIFKSLKTKL